MAKFKDKLDYTFLEGDSEDDENHEILVPLGDPLPTWPTGVGHW